MTRLELVLRVRSITRDFSNSIFREQDIVDFINEGINRFKQRIPELNGMLKLISPAQSVNLLPDEYQELLAIFASSRCYFQDERSYQATTLMNEFEVKLEEFQNDVEAGTIIIVDPGTDLPVEVTNNIDYVDNEPYWGVSYDLDDGVEGIE